jgi:hypothetical protein
MLKFFRKTALWILLAPAVIWGCGFAANQAVLIANHGTFPVEVNTLKEKVFVAKATATWEDEADDLGIDPTLPAGMIDDTHCIMTSKTHLNFLADVFDLKGDGIYSAGDFLLMLGDWLLGFAPFVWVFAVVQKLRNT